MGVLDSPDLMGPKGLRPGVARPKGSIVSWAVQQRAERAVQRLATKFAMDGIPVVPVKGVAFARFLYDDPAERPMLDADLLVPRDRLGDARAIVHRAGWTVFYE